MKWLAVAIVIYILSGFLCISFPAFVMDIYEFSAKVELKEFLTPETIELYMQHTPNYFRSVLGIVGLAVSIYATGKVGFLLATKWGLINN